MFTSVDGCSVLHTRPNEEHTKNHPSAFHGVVGSRGRRQSLHHLLKLRKVFFFVLDMYRNHSFTLPDLLSYRVFS